MKVRYHPAARSEVIEAANYYAAIRPQLGIDFSAELEAAITSIAADPNRFEQVRPGVRRYLFERFP